MARYVFLDAGPLGLASNARGKPEPDRCRNWLQALESVGVRIMIPEISDYEVRRELLRIRATAGIKRLDNLLARFPLLLVDRPALLRAAEVWAYAARGGLPTADPLSLDGDAILAGQVLAAIGSGDVATIATRNVSHLARFPGIDAQPWDKIT